MDEEEDEGDEEEEEEDEEEDEVEEEKDEEEEELELDEEEFKGDKDGGEDDEGTDEEEEEVVEEVDVCDSIFPRAPPLQMQQPRIDSGALLDALRSERPRLTTRESVAPDSTDLFIFKGSVWSEMWRCTHPINSCLVRQQWFLAACP